MYLKNSSNLLKARSLFLLLGILSSVLTLYFAEAHAMAKKSPQFPTGSPTDSHTGPIPSACQALREVRLGVVSRQLDYFNFDPVSCSYQNVHYSLSDEQVTADCENFMVAAGYALTPGSWECRDVTPIPSHVGTMVGCDANLIPSSGQQIFWAVHSYTDAEVLGKQCALLDQCLATELTDPAQILLARQWSRQLNCN